MRVVRNNWQLYTGVNISYIRVGHFIPCTIDIYSVLFPVQRMNEQNLNDGRILVTWLKGRISRCVKIAWLLRGTYVIDVITLRVSGDWV